MGSCLGEHSALCPCFWASHGFLPSGMRPHPAPWHSRLTAIWFTTPGFFFILTLWLSSSPLVPAQPCFTSRPSSSVTSSMMPSSALWALLWFPLPSRPLLSVSDGALVLSVPPALEYQPPGSVSGWRLGDGMHAWVWLEVRLYVARHTSCSQVFYLMDESEKDSGPPERKTTGRRGMELTVSICPAHRVVKW